MTTQTTETTAAATTEWETSYSALEHTITVDGGTPRPRGRRRPSPRTRPGRSRGGRRPPRGGREHRTDAVDAARLSNMRPAAVNTARCNARSASAHSLSRPETAAKLCAEHGSGRRR